MANILVTGGAGFIGSHIVDCYVEAGHNVIIIDNLSTGNISNINRNAIFYKKDIRDDLSDIFEKHDISIVNHHAAQISVNGSITDPIHDATINIIGSLNVIQSVVKYKVKRFIFASSGGAIYGEATTIPTPETYKKSPCSPYGVSKLTIENYLNYYNKYKGLNYIILRYVNVYGNRQNYMGEGGVVAVFTSKLLNGELPFINGDGKQTRDFVYVKDIAQINILALTNSFCGNVNIGTSVETDINTVYKTITERLLLPNTPKYKALAIKEQFRSALSAERAYHIFKTTPRTTLAEGITDYVRELRASK